MRSFSGARSASVIGRSKSRREFLRAGVWSVGGVALPAFLRPAFGGESTLASLSSGHSAGKSVIFVYLAGGPSHLDTYDMKPDAPADIRGQFRPINANVPGMQVCEHLPLHAKIADKFAIVNGVETVDTHSGSVVTTGELAGAPRPTTQTPVAIDRLPNVQVRIPALPHGDWDTHGRVLGRRLSIFAELRDKLPAYDRFVYELITDIYGRGLDRDVLVVACGEFGRTPWINRHGGRDHWAPCGSVLFAGGGLRMGQVVGDTGPIGERERSRNQPHTARDVLATVYRHLGIAPPHTATADGRTAPFLVDGRAIAELV